MRGRISVLLAVLWLLAAGRASSQRLLAHYPMDGQTTIDISGNRNNGVWHGGVSATADRFGRPCSALRFNGQDGYVEVASSASLRAPTQQLTVAVWCRLEPASSSAPRWLTLVCKGDGAVETPDNPHYRAQVLQAPAIQQSTVSVNSEFTEFDQVFAAHSFPVNTWFFYALTYDGSAVRSYQNGVEVFSFPYTGTLYANDMPLFIGRDAPGALEFFQGDLDELRLYDAALSPTRLLELYKTPAPKTAYVDFTLDCLPNREVSADPGQCSAVVTFAPPKASSPCGTVTVRQTSGPRSGEAFRMGSNTLVFSAESSDGQKKTCYTVIKVVDREAPRITCRPDTVITASATDPTGASWRYTLPLATDNCPNVRVQLSQGVRSGGRVPLGRSEIVFVATDQQGNRAECRRTVTVRAPAASAPAAPVLAAAPTTTAPAIPIPAPKPATSAAPPPVRNPTGPAIAPATPKPEPPAAMRRGNQPDSIMPGQTLQFKSCIITILAYDDYDEDGDSISVFFNQKEVVTKQMIYNKDHKVIIRAVMLDPAEKNAFVVKAWNIGRPGSPNTLTVEFFEGYYTDDDAKKLRRTRPICIRTLHAKPGLSASLYLTCKNK